MPTSKALVHRLAGNLGCMLMWYKNKNLMCWHKFLMFHDFFVVPWFFSKSTFSKNSFRNTISVKQFGSRSGLTTCWPWSGSIPFAMVISSQHYIGGRQRVNNYIHASYCIDLDKQWGEVFYVCIDALSPIQQFFSHVATFSYLCRLYIASGKSQTSHILIPSPALYHWAAKGSSLLTKNICRCEIKNKISMESGLH